MLMARKNLDWWCERGILILVSAMLVFAPLAFGAVDLWAILVVQSVTVLVLLLWGARLWLSRRGKILWPPLAWAVLAFVAYAVARYFTADIEYVARLELNQVIIFGFLFLCLLNNLRGQEETEAVSFTMIGVGTFCACYAVVQILRHSNQVWNEVSPYLDRASGTYISPNNLSNLLAMLLPLTLAYLLVGRLSIFARIFLGYAAVTMAVGLAVTFSRGGYISAAAGIILVLGVLLFHGNHRLRALLLLLVMLVGGSLFVKAYLSKTFAYVHRVNNPDVTMAVVLDTTARLEMWQAAAQMWLDHPWVGVGPDHYDYRFREYRPETIQSRPDRAHNDYLNLLADWGVAGGVIVLTGLGIFVFHLRQTWPHVRREENAFGTGQSNRFAFFLGAVGGLTALAVHSLVDFNLHIPANALVGVTLLALVASNVRFATEQHWRRLRRPMKIVFTIGLGVVSIYLAAQVWRAGGETYWLARAARQPVFSTPKAEALGRAFKWEPNNPQTAYGIGECFRVQSLDGGENFAEMAKTAMEWYAAASKLNPHDGYNYLRTGMCLDWLNRHGDSEKWFAQAEACDPNGYYMVANIGWHYVQIGDYTNARQWFMRSLKLDNNNPIALNYLAICERKLVEKASGKPVLPFSF
jgi:O-antigen ligase